MQRVVGSHRLTIIERGTGTPSLLFLHYFAGSSASWSDVMSQLQETAHCIAPDLPGFGDSDPIADPKLGHHVIVFMHQVMAVHHVLALIRTFPRVSVYGPTKLSNHPNRFKIIQQKYVFPSALVRTGRQSVAIDHLQIHKVNVYRMHPTCARIHEVSDLDRPRLRIGIDPLLVPGFIVDFPLVAVALKSKRAGGNCLTWRDLID